MPATTRRGMSRSRRGEVGRSEVSRIASHPSIRLAQGPPGSSAIAHARYGGAACTGVLGVGQKCVATTGAGVEHSGLSLPGPGEH